MVIFTHTMSKENYWNICQKIYVCVKTNVSESVINQKVFHISFLCWRMSKYSINSFLIISKTCELNHNLYVTGQNISVNCVMKFCWIETYLQMPKYKKLYFFIDWMKQTLPQSLSTMNVLTSPDSFMLINSFTFLRYHDKWKTERN